MAVRPLVSLCGATLPVDLLIPMELELPRVVAPLLVRELLLPRVVVTELPLLPRVSVLRLTWGFAELVVRSTLGDAVATEPRLIELLELLLLRLTWGTEAVELRLTALVELLRLTAAERSVLRLTDGAVELLERETAADWLLLLVLPPCERLRPWAIASDALKIRHPMRAKLIMIFVTEVFIVVLFYNVQQSD